MIKVTNREGKQVIDVNCEFITKVCDAAHTMERVMFMVNKYSPEEFDNLQKDVCSLLQELHTAFLKADDSE